MAKCNYTSDLFRLKYRRRTMRLRTAHSHTGIELHYCESGEGTFRVNGQCWDFESGRVTLLFAPVFHRMITHSNKEYCRTILHIPEFLVSQALSFMDLYDDVDFLPTRDYPIKQFQLLTRDYADMERVLRLIHREIPGEWHPVNPMVRLHVSELLYVIGRKAKSIATNGNHTSRQDQLIVDEACAIVRNSPLQDFSVEDLAASTGVSRGHLWRLFNDVLGVSPRHFLLQVRMEKAKQQLLEGKLVSEVADSCLYADVASFSRAFKNQVGMSPSHFLRSHHPASR